MQLTGFLNSEITFSMTCFEQNQFTECTKLRSATCVMKCDESHVMFTCLDGMSSRCILHQYQAMGNVTLSLRDAVSSSVRHGSPKPCQHMRTKRPASTSSHLLPIPMYLLCGQDVSGQEGEDFREMLHCQSKVGPLRFLQFILQFSGNKLLGQHPPWEPDNVAKRINAPPQVGTSTFESTKAWPNKSSLCFFVSLSFFTGHVMSCVHLRAMVAMSLISSKTKSKDEC